MRHKGMTFCKLLGLLVLTLLLTGCAQQPQAPFDGVIATSDVVFNLDFTALNTTYTSTLIVPEGKEIMADIQCDGGRIDVTITPEDGEPIYTGKRLPDEQLQHRAEDAGQVHRDHQRRKRQRKRVCVRRGRSSL